MEHTVHLLIIQIAVIIFAARAMGYLVRLIHLPMVVGEMIGGILLGPSVLGLINPAWQLALFPPESLIHLNVLSQIGVIFFMFLVGLELDLQALRTQGRAVVVAGLTSIIGPFVGSLVLGGMLWRYGGPGVQGEVKSGVAFMLFVATTLCISAFPVLARVLSERNLQRTGPGRLALACAAIHDALGWCILAVVFDISRTLLEGGAASPGMSVLQGLKTAGLALIYGAFMLLIVRRFLGGLQALFESRGYLPQSVLAIIFLLLLLSSFATDSLGIHLIFGAFMFGAIMPSESRFVRHLTDKTEDFVILFLLPIFFAYTGQKVDLTHLGDPQLWITTILLIVGATVLKVGFSIMAARWSKFPWRQSALLGVMLNTHGLMELIIANIALEIGAISPQVFSMLVVTLLVTTIGTAPGIRMLYSRERQKQELESTEDEEIPPGYHVLVPVSRPETAPNLMRMAKLLMGGQSGRVFALHLQRPGEPERLARSLYEQQDVLEVVSAQAKVLDVPVNTMEFVSPNIARDIAEAARANRTVWTIMGWHKPVFLQSILGGTVGAVLRDSPAHVGILIDKGLGDVKRVLVPYLGEPQDVGALMAAERIGKLPDVRVTILHVVPPGRHARNEEAAVAAAGQPAGEAAAKSPADGGVKLGVQQLVSKHLPAVGTANQVHMKVVESASPIDVITEESHRYDLIILGLSERWNLEGGLLGAAQESVAQLSACSLLITRASSNAPTPAVPRPHG